MNSDAPKFKSDQLLEELETHVLDVVKGDCGIGEAEAQQIAAKVAQRIWMSWGGQQVYISKQQPALQRRNEEIIAAFQGDNIDQLVRRFGLSHARLYAIIKSARGRRTF